MRQLTIHSATKSNPMKTTILTSLIATALCFGFGACDSKEEQARKAALEGQADTLENKAEAVREQTKTDAATIKKVGKLEAEADKEASAARVKAEKQAAEDAAKNLKKAGENTADALENKAKETREQK